MRMVYDWWIVSRQSPREGVRGLRLFQLGLRVRCDEDFPIVTRSFHWSGRFLVLWGHGTSLSHICLLFSTGNQRKIFGRYWSLVQYQTLESSCANVRSSHSVHELKESVFIHGRQPEVTIAALQSMRMRWRLWQEVTDVRRDCFPFVLFLETIYNSGIVTSGWRPWIVCV